MGFQGVQASGDIESIELRNVRFTVGGCGRVGSSFMWQPDQFSMSGEISVREARLFAGSFAST